jgi:hypothetical protein
MRLAGMLMMSALAVAVAGDAEARRMRVPGTECSVFSSHPCPRTVCSVFDRRPCIHPPDFWLSQDLRLTIDSRLADTYEMPDHDLDTIRDLFQALRACWRPPGEDVGRAGMQMSVRFSFKRNGDVIAPPRVTYTTPGVSPETRQTYRSAIDAAMQRCAPLALTKGLGGAIAGRPIAIRYVDDREFHSSQSNPQTKPENP